jgi:hypothetical protein
VLAYASMKPHHAAALALVGWYLMCAPYRSECAPGIESLWSFFGKTAVCAEHKLPDLDAPISERTQMAKPYDNLADCQQDATTTGNYPECTCIATDDPRLK